MTAETEYTPGPWHLFTNRHATTHGERWGSVDSWVHPAGGAGQSPAGTTITWHGATGEANARLIAAAPELLEALGLMFELHYRDDYVGLAKRVQDGAKAAIAKAVGA